MQNNLVFAKKRKFSHFSTNGMRKLKPNFERKKNFANRFPHFAFRSLDCNYNRGNLFFNKSQETFEKIFWVHPVCLKPSYHSFQFPPDRYLYMSAALFPNMRGILCVCDNIHTLSLIQTKRHTCILNTILGDI